LCSVNTNSNALYDAPWEFTEILQLTNYHSNVRTPNHKTPHLASFIYLKLTPIHRTSIPSVSEKLTTTGYSTTLITESKGANGDYRHVLPIITKYYPWHRWNDGLPTCVSEISSIWMSRSCEYNRVCKLFIIPKCKRVASE